MILRRVASGSLLRAWFDKSKTNGESTGEKLKNLNDLKERFFHQRSTNTNSSVDDIGGISGKQPSYDMLGKKGCALIISNSFKNRKDLKRAEASAKDIENMESLWKVTLGCELYKDRSYQDQSAKEMAELLEAFSNITGNYSYVVVVISTHGGIVPKRLVPYLESVRGQLPFAFFHDRIKRLNWFGGDAEVLYGDDVVPLPENEILKYFHNSSIGKTLQNIPKIFILDYCRGQGEDQGVKWGLKSFGNAKAGPSGPSPEGRTDEINEWEPAIKNPPIPTVSDILTVYATHRDFTAFQDPYGSEGSWLITDIKNIFEESWQTKTVVEMLTMVNAAMKKRSIRGLKAMSTFNSSLVKELKFAKTERSDEQT